MEQTEITENREFFEQARALFQQVGNQGALNYNRACLERLGAGKSDAG